MKIKTHIFSYFEYGKLVKTYEGSLEDLTFLTHNGLISELERVIRFLYGLSRIQYSALLNGETITEGNFSYSLALS